MTSRLLLAAALALAHSPVHGRDAVECSASQGGKAQYWSWREVDGRRCYYAGRPGKPKSELYWGEDPSKAAPVRGQPEAGQHDAGLAAAPEPPPEPPPTEPTTEKPTWQATMEDQLLAFTCCWPELEPSRMLNKIQDRVLEIPKATPPSDHPWVLWQLMLLPVAVIAVSVLLAKRRLT